MSQDFLMRLRPRVPLRQAELAFALALLLSLATAVSAQATSSVGQLFVPTYTTCASGTFLQSGVASGNSYTVPASGAITSWSFETNTAVVPGLELKVAEAAGEGNYTVVGESAAGEQTASSINTYAVHIPVKAGDIIGIYEGGGGCFSAAEAADTYAWVSATDEGLGTAPYGAFTNGRTPVSAVLTVPPAASTSPASSIGATGATLNGVVGPEESRTAYFQYGTSTAYGATTAQQNIGASGSASSVSATLAGLAPATTFHFRAVAENAGGLSYGADQTFTTAATTATTTMTTSTNPPIEKGKPVVNVKTGEITLEYEFPEPGEAQQEGQVVQGASLARLTATSLLGVGDPLTAFDAKNNKCKKAYIRKGRKCVNNAPVRYGRATLAIPAAGIYRLHVKPGAKVLAALKKGKTLGVRLTLVFTPAATADHITETTSARVHLKLKKMPHGKGKT